MKIVIIALGTTVSFVGGIITHYGSILEHSGWVFCGVILFACGTFTAMFVENLR